MFNRLSPEQQLAILEALEALRDRCPDGRTRGFHLLERFSSTVDIRIRNQGLSTFLPQELAQVLLDDPECVVSYECEDCGLDVPSSYFDECPACAGIVGYSAYYYKHGVSKYGPPKV